MNVAKDTFNPIDSWNILAEFGTAAMKTFKSSQFSLYSDVRAKCHGCHGYDSGISILRG